MRCSNDYHSSFSDHMGTLPILQASCHGRVRCDDGASSTGGPIFPNRRRCTDEQSDQQLNWRPSMKILQRPGNQKGFTLLELLIAVSFLAIALLAVAGLQTTAIHSNSIANKLSAATSIAQQIMEDIAARPMDDPLLNSTNTNINYNFNLNPMTTPVFSIAVPNAGTYSATYSTAINNPTSGVTKLDIFVIWDAATGRKIALTTFVRTN